MAGVFDADGVPAHADGWGELGTFPVGAQAFAGDELADFADTENEALLELMYQGCADREGEMEYSEIDLLLAEKLEILADSKVIKENW